MMAGHKFLFLLFLHEIHSFPFILSSIFGQVYEKIIHTVYIRCCKKKKKRKIAQQIEIISFNIFVQWAKKETSKSFDSLSRKL